MGHDSHVSTELWEDVLWAQNSWGLRWGNGRGHEGEAAWSHLPTCSTFAGCFSSPLSWALRIEGAPWDAKLPPHPGSSFSGTSGAPAASQNKHWLPVSRRGI